MADRIRSEHGAPPRMPRWVKLSVVIVGALAVLALFLAVLGGGQHGPGRHLGASDAGRVSMDVGGPGPVVTASGPQPGSDPV